MEAFGIYDDDDPTLFNPNYPTLSQFDLDLQQQAQAALQHGGWQDLDMFLPQVVGVPQLFYNEPTTPPSQSSPPQQQPLQQQQEPSMNIPQSFIDSNPIYNPALLGAAMPSKLIHSTMPISPPLVSFDATPIVPSQWSGEPVENLKTEYPSPENVAYSPASESKSQLEQVNFIDSLPPSATPAAVIEQAQSQPSSAIATPPSAAASPPPAAAPASTWNNNGFPEAQGNKVPIQRLKPPATSAATQQNTVGLVPANGGRQQKKTAHNAIERRYRNNINDRIAELKNAVPALLHAKLKDSRTGKRSHRAMDDDDDDAEDAEEYLDGVAVATKLNKATILRKATEYITHLKKTGDDMRQENAVLQHLLTQLPGGQEVLGRYRMQKVQREQDLQRQRMVERQQLQKQQQQQRKPGRKRTRTVQAEEYESGSTTGSDPATPPPVVGNRVFMAVFACLTFFSSSPLTAGPSSTEQFQNHHHASRAASAGETTATDAPPIAAAPAMSLLGSWLPFDSTWAMLRTLVFVLFIGHLLFPYLRSWVFGRLSLNVKRVPRAKRVASRKRIQLSNAAVASAIGSITPGDQKCLRIYDIIVRSLELNEDGPPRSAASYLAQTAKEAARLISRQAFGYEILYNEDDRLVPEDEWEQICQWIKLNEIECLGGNPEITRATMLHSCLRMINLAEVLDDEEHEFLQQMRARVYATASIQFAAILRNLPFANRVSRYFWRLAVYETSSDMRNPNSDEGYMRSLVWMIQQQDESIEDILKSQAWNETVQVIRHQVGHADTNLSLSLTAPVLVPVAILSTLHLLDSLQQQYGRLIAHICNQAELTSDTFASILSVTRADDDHQRLAHWLAAVGMTVETLWKNDVKAAETYMATVLKRVPRALMVNHSQQHQDIVAHKNMMNELDEHIKRHLIHVLTGATLIKRGDQAAGVDQLQMAEGVQSSIKKLKASTKSVAPQHLESVVMASTEFAVALINLDAWISAWKQSPSQENVREIREKVRTSTVTLRRMIRRPILQDLQTNQMIARLVRLNRFVARQPDEVDSACDCSDIESDDDGDGASALLYDTDGEEDEMLVKRADKALDILHGIL
ncbi:hypothetical protein BJV82DRAFT_666654 [Fennellomyces sp. T-0311]|nr:hypothetical protein BJV82DRAFT_666654 [Fennellomyces sp. T-0311]